MKDHERPSIGPTGSSVLKCEITRTTNSTPHWFSPPTRPLRVEYDFDDAGDVIDRREYSEEEHVERLRQYEKAKAEHDRTGGLFFSSGHNETECRVTCADGVEAIGIWTGEEWAWVSYGPTNAENAPTGEGQGGERE